MKWTLHSALPIAVASCPQEESAQTAQTTKEKPFSTWLIVALSSNYIVNLQCCSAPISSNRLSVKDCKFSDDKCTVYQIKCFFNVFNMIRWFQQRWRWDSWNSRSLLGSPCRILLCHERFLEGNMLRSTRHWTKDSSACTMWTMYNHNMHLPDFDLQSLGLPN